MPVRTSATRIWRCNCRGKEETRAGSADDQECFGQTECKTVAPSIRARGADRLHPAPGVAAPCHHLRPRNRNQSDADAMGGAGKAHRDRAVLAESARPADG